MSRFIQQGGKGDGVHRLDLPDLSGDKTNRLQIGIIKLGPL